MKRLPDNPLPALGAQVEILFVTQLVRGRVVGRSFDRPVRIDVELPGGGRISGIPVNESLRILEGA